MTGALWRPSWAVIEARIMDLAGQIQRLDGWAQVRSIHGVPRGGCVPAAMLAIGWGLPLADQPDPDTLVVDDLIDSGHTMATYAPFRFVALYRKSWSPQPADPLRRLAEPVPADAWVHFPWEGTEAPAVDAVVRLLQAAGFDTSGSEATLVAEREAGEIIDLLSARCAGMLPRRALTGQG